MAYKELTHPEKWLILGVPALFIIGYGMHLMYDLAGKITLIGILAPANESLWEHLKMLLIPMISWWCIYYEVNGKKYNINKEKWIFANVISIMFSMLTLLAFYYTYTQAFGIKSLYLDIFDLLLSVTVGQCIGLHIYKHGKGVKIQASICILILFIIVFVTFTFYPPHIPLFKDSASGLYGI